MGSDRAGTYKLFPDGSRRFIPKPLPPDPPLELNLTLFSALAKATDAIARLDGAARVLPNPDLLVYAFMRQEAVLSSQIEGTQVSLDDVLRFEGGAGHIPSSDDLRETINYIEAINWGVSQLTDLPICNRLIKGLHARLLASGRGANKRPGDFREDQVWIAAPGVDISKAAFVPPPKADMETAINEWEGFANQKSDLPVLIKSALLHAQFETIHPFADGNGRLGRMIITLHLMSEGVLKQPLLYPSLYLKSHKDEYFKRLQGTRDAGAWEEWINFFLTALESTAVNAFKVAEKIIELREEVLNFAHSLPERKAGVLASTLFHNPYITASRVANLVGVSNPTARKLTALFEAKGFLKKLQGVYPQTYYFDSYLKLLQTG